MREMKTGIGHKDCVILPFSKDDENDKTATATTTMAALLAVTVVHDKNISAEERLIQIIEKSGEVEILDTEDALADMGFEPGEIGSTTTPDPAPANDNAPLKAV